MPSLGGNGVVLTGGAGPTSDLDVVLARLLSCAEVGAAQEADREGGDILEESSQLPPRHHEAPNVSESDGLATGERMPQGLACAPSLARVEHGRHAISIEGDDTTGDDPPCPQSLARLLEDGASGGVDQLGRTSRTRRR